LCRFADLPERFEKRGMGIDFIVDLIRGFSSLDDPQGEQILEFSLSGLQTEARFIHNLSLIKGLTCTGEKKL
jgi:hypothetical protein